MPDVTVDRRPRQPFSDSPPLRPSQQTHGSKLSSETNTSFQRTKAARTAAGIDPSKLVVLCFSFAVSNQRTLLEKLGLTIVQETEDRMAIEPFYSALVDFKSASDRQSFMLATKRKSKDFDECRNKEGVSHETRVRLKFTNKNEAETFIEENNTDPRIDKFSKPQKQSVNITFRTLVQFKDSDAQKTFENEQRLYEKKESSDSLLTYKQRMQLFDSLESIEEVGEKDRKGLRLQTESLPKEPFFFDVDLWHPGAVALIAESIKQFRELVLKHGGTITDGPTVLADTLLIARVTGTKKLVDALLKYDRVAHIDLPPLLHPPNFSVFENVDAPESVPKLPDDAPVACIVDSGVTAGHPLLNGLVIDEEDFDSGEPTVSDMEGHGTHIGGIIVYGDVGICAREKKFIPKVRLISAKVMKAVWDMPSAAGGICRPGFADESRVETQIRNAVTRIHQKHGCKIFNLSFGNPANPYYGGRQLALSLTLDELSAKLDVVCIVPTGNVPEPEIPNVSTEEQFQPAIRDQLYSRKHALIDPSTSALSLSVGSLAHSTQTVAANTRNARMLIGAPINGPSPFTRTGAVKESGDGLLRAVKPEFVAYGGNYALRTSGRSWLLNDAHLGIISLNREFAQKGLLKSMCGTSMAAPYVTHVASQVECMLRKLGNNRVSANLIRALVAHSATVPLDTKDWLADGHSDGDAELRRLRACGYGVPQLDRALRSSDNRSVLFAEDEIPNNKVHLYELFLPNEFTQGNADRIIKITLAYNPPLNGRRKEYLSRTMHFQLYRDLSEEALRDARTPRADTEKYSFPACKEAKFRPTYTCLQWSTLQSAAFKVSRETVFALDQPGQDSTWHIMVQCEERFEMGLTERQPYAIVVSLEHPDQHVRIHQRMELRVTQRIRQRWS